ncbi:PAS domain S-box protein [Salinirussus salinus]|uniref:PAS domain S-box protein n=1 Tax=Salinirussus salinus TaxID=1198300 RepID=UPI001356CFEE|nr:PAS domain S-box protein [Salinirussus salinus]
MFPLGPGPLRVGVFGNGSIESPLSDAEAVDRPLDVEPVEPATVVDSDRDQPLHCVVVDSASGVDCTDVVEECTEKRPELPVVALTNGADGGAVEALEAGADETLPAAVTETAPELFAERVVETVERERAREGLQELYDGVAGGVTLHDPETGEVLRANRQACEALGYPREELRSLSLGALTADVAGYDGERAREVVGEAAGQEEPVTLEWPFERADGTVRWTDSRVERVTFGPRELVLWAATDATERRQLERTYREVFESISDGLVVHDPETGEIRDVNDRFCEMNGYDREELVGEAIDVVAGPDHAYEEARDRIAAAREEGPQLFEWHNERADGETFPVEVHLRVVEIRGEERVLASVRDITERREREERLEERRRLYSTLVEQSPNGVMIVQDESVQFVNPRMERLTGWSESELLGRPFYEVMTEEYRDLVKERYEQRTSGDRPPRNYEVEVRTSDGERRIIDLHVSRIQYRGEPATLATFDDVTERRRQQRELRESERRFQLIADHIDEIIYLATADFSEILYINDAYEEVYGRPVEELDENPTSFVEAAHPEDRARYEEDVERLRADVEAGDFQEAYEGEYRIQRDGETRWVAVTRFPVEGEDGTVDRIVGRVQDVTARKRREREYEQVFNGVNDAIAVFDPETGEITDVNDTYREMLGYDDLGTIRELGIEGLSATEEGYTGERGKALIGEVADTGEPTTVEWRGETKDGERLWLEATLSPGTVGGEERVLSIQRDVTARKRREQEYEQVFNGVPDPITVNDPETGEMIAVNDAMCETVSYDRETVLEKGLDGLSVTEEGYTSERAAEIIDGVMESGESRTFEWKLETAEGDHRVLEVTGKPATVGGEERYISLTRDVTERKRREQEYEQVFNSVTDGIVVFDPEAGELTDVNDTYLEMVGYDDIETIRELGAEGLSADGPEFTGERVDSIVERVAKTGETETVEWEVERADGEQRVFEVNSTTATVGGEKRVLSLNRDVTERKRREREYEQIFNGVNDGIAVHDPETGEVIDVNEPMCELTGYDREALLAEGGSLVDVPEEGYSSERAGGIVREVMETGERRTFEWLVERKDGQRRWLEVNATPAVLNGEPRCLSLMRDVTEQRRTERRLEEILERIDEAVFMTRAEEITGASQAPDYVSSGYEEIWGQPIEAIRETYEAGFFGTLHPDDEAGYRAFVEGIAEDIAAGDAADRYAREYRIERPDGEVRWVHSDYYPTEWETGSTRVVIVSRDVTERKARERRIASFDDATEDLATADTPAEATRTAVEAAAETLGLPAVGAFLYDEEEGVLRPAVTAGPLPAAVAEPVGPGDGPLWEGFATGTVVAPDGGDSEPGLVGDGETATPAELSDLAGWRALALGNHGVLLVGSPDRALGSKTIQAAHVLAATLEAALNHLEGQQRLEAQQEQLRTQTERAERLDRIARLTQQVEAAITDASTPSEVERAVCRRLAGSGPYDLAWVGGAEVGTDRLAPRAVVGAPDQYVGALDLSAEGTADPHPAVTAWRTDDLQVADSLVDSGPAGDWRRRALSEGYQSLCAAPLTYDGVTHGVLTVGVESPNAFGERERDVLAQLGTSIANALAAVERRRALESDETVELEFRGKGQALPFAQAAEAAGCRVGLERTATRQDGSVGVYFSFEGDVPENVPAVARRTLPGSVDVVAEEPSSTLVEVRTDDWFGSPLAEYGGVLREASAEPGETTVTVEVPTEADVRSFVERLQSVAPSLELVARRQHSTQGRTPTELSDQVQEALTDRQLEVLRTALSAGYFEWPRENDGSEVASRLDITQPTLNKHLRLAERKVFGLLFEPGG